MVGPKGISGQTLRMYPGERIVSLDVAVYQRYLFVPAIVIPVADSTEHTVLG